MFFPELIDLSHHIQRVDAEHVDATLSALIERVAYADRCLRRVDSQLAELGPDQLVVLLEIERQMDFIRVRAQAFQADFQTRMIMTAIRPEHLEGDLHPDARHKVLTDLLNKL